MCVKFGCPRIRRKGVEGVLWRGGHTFGMKLLSGKVFTSKKSHYEFLSINNGNLIEWFTLPEDEEEGGVGYGRFKGIYVVDSDLNLLNLGHQRDRDLVRLATDLEPHENNTDFQYSCHDSNLLVHRAIYNSRLLDDFDGTIVTRKHSDKELLDSLHGVGEIVLFLDRVKDKISLVKVVEEG